MKRIKMTILFVFITFLANAQIKPSKEETIKFMTSILKKSEYVDGADYKRQFLDFSGDIIKWRNVYNRTYAYEDIDWSSYKLFTFFVYETHIWVSIDFDNPLKKFADYPSSMNLPRSISVKEIEWYLPLDSENKLESLKKACLRLKEIWQEENKDPFAN